MQTVLGMGRAEGIYYWLLGRVKKTREVKDRTNIGQVLEFSGRSLVLLGPSANIAGLIKSYMK
jgi:hypothetical protein